MSESQWLFSIDALDFTPSNCSRERELYDRARGVEFLFRLGASLVLSVVSTPPFKKQLMSYILRPTSAMCTAATWFHRFFMRCSMQDFHRQVCPPFHAPRFIISQAHSLQHVAASCIFLATKTEECGRKLRDVARVSHAKAENRDITTIPADCQVKICFF